MDNTIRLSEEEIDFQFEVGLTGKEHDHYPSAGDPVRFDWMRMYLTGLLANQSSQEQPCEFRIGTLWFNLLWGNFYYHGQENKYTLPGRYANFNNLIDAIATPFDISLPDFIIEQYEHNKRSNKVSCYASICIQNNYDIESHSLYVPEIHNFRDKNLQFYKNGSAVSADLLSLGDRLYLSKDAQLSYGQKFILIAK